MIIKYMSDLHLEFKDFNLKYSDDDSTSILVIAGDLGVGYSGVISFLKKVSKRFYKVIFISGNHEYYNNNDIILLDKIFREELFKTDNIHYLNNENIIINNVKFVGSTLWIDFNKKNPIEIEFARNSINDFNYIRFGKRKLVPNDVVNLYNNSVKYLTSIIDKKTIVITHYAPIVQACDPKYQIGNYSFVSDLSELILDTKPIAWIYGHTHRNFECYVGPTEILSNQRGYPHDYLEFRPTASFCV